MTIRKLYIEKIGLIIPGYKGYAVRGGHGTRIKNYEKILA
jgi:hypothetical protein